MTLKVNRRGPWSVSIGLGLESALSLAIGIVLFLCIVALVLTFGSLAVFAIAAAGLIGLPCLFVLGLAGCLQWAEYPVELDRYDTDAKASGDGYGESVREFTYGECDEN